MKNIIWSIGHELKIPDIIRADNCQLVDSKGNRFIDLESGVWCTSLGHNNPRINRIICNQLDYISHTGFCYSNSVIDQTAAKILNITNLQNGKCEFLCSGSEAVEYGMRVARTIADKPLCLTFSDSYFGAYGEATIKDSTHWHVYDWLKCNCNKGKGNCTAECDEFNNIPFDKIGIFLFEPGSSSGLVRFPTTKLMDKVIEKIKENDAIIMVNEITTGVGRTGRWFGFQHYNLSPDIIAIGKGIGNGYPVSLIAISETLSKQLDRLQFHYSQSHQNDPLGASVAGEVIQTIIDENLLDRSRVLGNYLFKQLNVLKRKYSVVKKIRSRGLMILIEFTDNTQWIYEELMKAGFIVAKRPNIEAIRLDPALTIEQIHIDHFLKKLEEIIKKIKN